MDHLNAGRAAERAGVTPSTVSRWVQAGRLAAERSPTGELQIKETDLDEFLARRKEAPKSAAADAGIALAAAQERIKGLGGACKRTTEMD